MGKIGWPASGFAGRLREIRETRGLSAGQLAQMAGVHLTTVLSLENGKTREPAWPLVLALASALQVTPDAFVVALPKPLPVTPPKPRGRPRKAKPKRRK